jgi:AraC-like DNA-binding protein
MKRVLPAFSRLISDGRYCHVRPLRGRAAGPTVTVAGDERCLPHYRVSRSGFACWGMEFIAEGEGSLVLAGRLHPVRPGNAFIYGPHIPHEIRTEADKPMRKYFVNYFGDGAKAFMANIGLKPGELRRVADASATQQIFDELLREGQSSHRNRAETVDAYLRLLLLKIADIPARAAAAPSRAHQTWQRCQALLDEHSDRIKGLRELSRLSRVDPSHLCRLFQRYSRSSPHTELTRRKMNRAASLLLSTPDLVKSIAAQVGYDDPLHFSRAFRRHFGASPKSFRAAEALAAL